MIILSCWRFWKKISLNSWFPSFFRSDCTIQEAFLPAADVVSFGALSDALGRAQQWELVLEILQACWLNGFNEQMLNGASYYDLFWYMIDIWLIYYWYMIDILWYISRVPFGCKQLQKKGCELWPVWWEGKEFKFGRASLQESPSLPALSSSIIAQASGVKTCSGQRFSDYHLDT